MSDGVSPSALSGLRRRWKRLRRVFYPLAVVPLEAWAKRIPEDKMEVWARRFGQIAYWVSTRARHRAHRHLHQAYGATFSSQRIKEISQEIFQNLALNFIECVRYSNGHKDEFLNRTTIDGWEHIEAAHRAGQGGILLSGHIGNWELAAASVALRGYPVGVVARQIYLSRLNLKLARMRETMGVKTFYRDEPMRSMIRHLKNNGFIGVVADQDIRSVSGIFVGFFGRPAYTPTGPALLALASGSPILISRDIRQGLSHRIVVDPPIYADATRPREDEVKRLVTLYTGRLEEFIRENPSHWVWSHRRWRTSPPTALED